MTGIASLPLRTVLKGVSYFASRPLECIEKTVVTDVCYNSKLACSGTVFVCIVGETVDGHRYAKNAYDNGCRVFVIQKDTEISTLDDIITLKVENSRQALAIMSHNLFDNPAKDLKIIGVTGTKGKTTIANLIASVLNDTGVNTGCIGTNGIWYNEVHLKTENTTPESYELAKSFRNMVDAGVKCVVMEVSSQGIMMNRTLGITFLIGVFTNLSPDHIGPKEHKDFDDYLNCKARLFSQCDVGLINIDDEHYKEIIQSATCEIRTFSMMNTSDEADYYGANAVKYSDEDTLGIRFDLRCKGDSVVQPVILNTPGIFSVYNALAVIGVCDILSHTMGVGKEMAINSLKTQVVRGRMELVKNSKGAIFIIDFAHNELSFTSLFTTIMEYKKGRIISLFGSVGGRTKLRRRALGKIAAQYSDLCIITSDNPDFENPQDIIDDIIGGVEEANALNLNGNGCEYISFVDRKEAIRFAVDEAKSGDIVIFTGKGHEEYQLINGVKELFCERDIILEHLVQV